MNLGILLTFWVIPALLFLGVSLMVRRKMLLPAIALNIAFLSTAYISEAQMLSNARPIYDKIPFYTHGNWSGSGVKILFSQTKGKDNTFVLVEEDGVPRLYNMPYDPVLADALKRTGKNRRLIVNDSAQEMDTQRNLKIGGLPERSYEPKSDSEGNVQDY